MSGINELKKKAKLSIDEMYDTQPVGKLDNQKEINPDIHQTNQTAIHNENKTLSQLSNPSQNSTQSISKSAAEENQAKHSVNAHDFQVTTQNAVFPTKQQNQKASTYKMTFNLSEGVYKAFNDLYAQRMLQGRKTEKSEMINEAIQWLIKMEKTLV